MSPARRNPVQGLLLAQQGFLYTSEIVSFSGGGTQKSAQGEEREDHSIWQVEMLVHTEHSSYCNNKVL